MPFFIYILKLIFIFMLVLLFVVFCLQLRYNYRFLISDSVFLILLIPFFLKPCNIHNFSGQF
jgi:hypothetical protein